MLDKLVVIDQSPIGRTPRSNPATYTGAFDLIRDLYSHGARTRRCAATGRGGSRSTSRAAAASRARVTASSRSRCTSCPTLTCSVRGLQGQALQLCRRWRFSTRGSRSRTCWRCRVDEASEFFSLPSRASHNRLEDNRRGRPWLHQDGPAGDARSPAARRSASSWRRNCRNAPPGGRSTCWTSRLTGLHFADIHKLLDVLQAAGQARQYRADDRAQPRRRQDGGLPDRPRPRGRRPRRHDRSPPARPSRSPR